MKTRSILIFLFTLSSSSFLDLEAKTVYLRDGKVLDGEIINQTATYVDLELPNHEVLRIQKKAILKISFGKSDPQKPKVLVEQTEEPRKEQAPVNSVATEGNNPPNTGPKLPTRIVRDPLQRHFLEFYVGGGSGNLSSHTVGFFYKVQSIKNIIATDIPFVLASGPNRTSKDATSGGAAYKYKRFNVEAGGFSIRSTTSSQNVGVGTANPAIISGSYPEELRGATAKISYSFLAKPNYEFYPTLGYLQIWNKTKDDHSALLQVGNLAGNSTFHALENLKGMSIGLGFAYHFGSKWEIKTEIESITLKGSQSIRQDFIYSPVTPPFTLTELPSTDIIDWKAKGYNASFRVTYFWKMGLGFWIGIETYRWRYEFQKGDFVTYQVTTAPSPQQALIDSISQNYYASQIGSSTKATSVQIGLSKAINFGPEEIF
ncbi:hypothetical protein EHQ53_01045 [Leptospira langatensis]|uniref:Uncharacterized protein n=1 Tax=Leptospira langatensis TaxID=2484983 RepID=A0A5F1ZZ32_9LEPT|nr:hypothetical protein [Leptospira langatensis]TGJ98344.1 hypothetical protein EHO57_17190 [Leptospira langatensis]TGL43257.1 hypothetical protein EHQ53_01045 [Leptospira langatensis]